MHNVVYAGDSWAAKAWTDENYQLGPKLLPTDVRMADYWELDYSGIYAGGWGNLEVLNKLSDIDSTVPIIWVYTEPGRDYGRITGQDEFGWIVSEDIMSIRQSLDHYIMNKIRNTLSNPIALIGGLSDVNIELAEELNFTVLHPSWQRFIAERLESKWFRFGWGASDIGWRFHYNKITPSKRALFESEVLIREWCFWQEHGYICHDHPTVLANQQFAEYLKPEVHKWLNSL